MSSVVVDTSFAFKWVVDEQGHQVARRLLLNWQQDDVHRLAPSLILSEINTPLLKLCRQGRFVLADALTARDLVFEILEVLPDDDALTRRAMEIADALGLRNAHDSLFLTLAGRHDCDLWTADERFWNVAKAAHPRVHWLGEHGP